jgi:ATP-binding cassette, subfamily B, bacterial MsbA
MLRPHGLRLGLGAVCLLLLAATGAAYAYVTGPVLRVVLSGGEQGASYLVGLLPLPAAQAWAQQADALILVAVVLVALALLKGLAHLGQSILLDGTVARAGHLLRVRLYDHLMRAPLQTHRRIALGDLLTRLLDDLRQVQDALVAAPITLAREGLAAAALLTVAIVMAPRLALAAAVALPVSGVIIALFSRGVRRATAGRQVQLSSLADRAAQGLQAIREVKSCGAEQREVDRFGAHGQRALGWTLRRIVILAVTPLFNEVMAAAALGGTLVYAGGQIASGALPPERFVSFFAAVLLMYKPIKAIGRAVHLAAAGAVSLERLAALLDGPQEPPADGAPLRPLSEALVLRGVSFAYDDALDARQALQGADLRVPTGSITALAGPSGAGKSTLANIVCGLERPSSGQVLWDDVELTAAPLALLRAQVALVPQQPLLLDGTLAENLRYGAPEASDAQLREALAAVGLEQAVARLDGGLAARLGTGGAGLSAGEVQRLAVARAVLRQVNLVVLDEPSSALDPEAAELLRVLLEELKRRNRAVLIVAHTDGLLRAADRVVRLEEGRVTEGEPRQEPGARPGDRQTAS